MTTTKIETYDEMKARHSKEYNDFTKDCVFFAFSMNQFNEGMKKIGLDPGDTDKVYSIGHGGCILRTKSREYNGMLKRFTNEHNKAVADDKDGTGYIRQMFEYEMNNHEYGYTRDIEDTLDALGLTLDEINNDERLLNGFKIAKKVVIDWFDEHN